MQALDLFAGPRALRAIAQGGLQAADICTIAAAAGGPKGLLLGPIDRFLFGHWLPQSSQPVHLVGASIGAWRMATACLDDPVAALQQLEHAYIHQHYELAPGQRRLSADLVSEVFGRNLRAFYAGRVPQVLQHPRYRLHVLTSRGRHLLATEHALRTPVGYLGAFLTNALHRRAMGAWLERVVFSAPAADAAGGACSALPFGSADYRTRQVRLSEANFNQALQASFSIPFVLRAVHN
ncbi:MAG: phospholipase, partial [Rhodoferax sp.]